MTSPTWTEYEGFDVTGAFRGITTPIGELYGEIARQGWEVQKVESPKKDGFYTAIARHPDGTKQKGLGRSAPDAVAHLLTQVMRANFMHAGSVRLATWKTDWSHRLPEVAQAYLKAPIYDPKAVGGWMELAQDSVRRADALRHHLTIEPTDHPEPYETPQKMWEDVHKKGHYYASRADSDHPLWTGDQAVAFRTVHDVLGHCVSGGDFGWSGTNRATRAHLPLLSPEAQRALFTETIGRKAFGTYYRSFPTHKIAYLKDFIDPAQEAENPGGHVGVHPSQSVPMVEGPKIEPKAAAVSGADPNAGWTSGVDPLPNNAFQWQSDPLDAHADGGMLDIAGKLDTGWHSATKADGSPDHEIAKQAVVNALRGALLAPRKDPEWHAVHYQHIAGIPAGVDDPKHYADTLETQRETWNQAHGFAPGSHKTYWKAERDFLSYVRSLNPEMPDHEVRELGAREWHNLWNDEEERIDLDPKHDKLGADQIEARVAKEVERRVLTMLKPTQNDKTDVPLSATAAADAPAEPGRYGGFLRTHLTPIARVSTHADPITEAALADVHRHGGSGHHFRSSILSLGIPGIGAKETSQAWLHLQPKTSQLAVIDKHVMDVLGRRGDKDMNPRDYFKFERELAAGRDAAGYSHVPLAPFQWGMWDLKRAGLGAHHDRSFLRPLNPTPHDQVEWSTKTAPEGPDWAQAAPQWWADTEPARQATGDHWDQAVATRYPSNAPPLVSRNPVTAGADDPDEFCVAFQIPIAIKNLVSNWAAQLEWPEDFELDDPEQYHCTVMYASSGWQDPDHHQWIRNYALKNIPMEAWKLELFGPEADTVVLRLKTEQGTKWAERLIAEAQERGLEPSYADNYKPHITIGKAKSLPKGDRLTLNFRSGPLFLYAPRDLQDDRDALRHVLSSSGRTPWFYDASGALREGDPDQSLMHHLRNSLGASTTDVWLGEHECGKR